MKPYVLYVTPYGRSAKNRGIVGTGPCRGATRFAFQARDNAEAYRLVCEQFQPDDPRPLAGKSYIRPIRFKVGQRVRLLTPYAVGWTDDGKRAYADVGTISEVVCDTVVSVEFPGYHTRFVDFGYRELA